MNNNQTQCYKGNILIVDNNPETLQSLTALLTKHGYRVRPVPEFRLLNTDISPDLILLAANLPGMNGYEACEYLKADKKNCDIPVIFISDSDDAPDKTGIFSAGGADYITRPFHEQEVLARIKTNILLYKTQKNLEQENIRLQQETLSRRQAEEALCQSKKMFRFLAENANDVIWIMDTNGNLTYISPSVIHLRGYTPEETMKHSLGQRLTPESFTKALEVMARYLKGEDVKEKYELEMVKKGGSTVWTEVVTSPIKDNDGKPVGLLGVTHDIGKRKQAEEKLRHSEEKLSIHMQQTPLAYIEWNTNLEVLDWNPSAEKIFGYTREEAMNRHAYDLIVPDTENTLAHVNGVRRSLLEQTGGTQSINENITKDGRTIICQWYNTSLADKDGQLIEIASFAQDITETIQMTEALSESEERYRTLIETIPHGIHECDASGITTFVNAQYIKMLGYQENEIVGKPIWELIMGTDAEKKELQKYLQYLVKNQPGLVTYVSQNKTRNGDVIDIDVDWNYKRDKAGNIIGFISIITDTTERRKAEALLREREELFRAVFQNAGVGVSLADMNRKIVQTNPALRRILGYTDDELIGMTFTELTHPDDREKSSILHREIVEGKRDVYRADRRCFRKDKELVWTNVTVSLIRKVMGKPEFTLEMTEDITEQRKILKELEDARKQAEAASRAKSEFLANMSHEIRTPMNAILGFSEILMNKAEQPDQKNCLANIQSGGKSLLALINDILDLSKIEAGKLEIQSEPVSVRNLLHEVRMVFLHKLKEKGIELHTHISSTIPTGLLMDEVRIRQILINLVGNAIKFTYRGCITVSVYCDNETGEKNRISPVFEVKDTGIGIYKDQYELIFENFRQQDGQKTRKYGGTGLGLAITKRLAEMMNGTITVESEVGRGSIFRVMFSDVEIVKVSDKARKISDPEDINIEFEPAAILVVDDIHYNREIIKGFLDNTPFSVFEAEDGEEALDMLGILYDEDPEFALDPDSRISKPDLILMDMKMPGKSGYEVTELIKNSDELKHIPVIAVTASAMKETEEILNFLCDGCVVKPFGKAELISELKRHLPYEVQGEKPCEEKKAAASANAVFSGLTDLLPELIQILDSFIPTWEDIWDSLIFDEVRDFAEQVNALGAEYACGLLTGWSETVIRQMQDIDVERLPGTFGKFPEIIIKLRKIEGA
ncbi:MAG: PAS domain S-box protein [Desulfobacterales bacterium]|nr:PAS domain S-box protein [Desulfobacterales bacterium]